MGLFNGMNSNGLESNEDRLVGGSGKIFDTDIYTGPLTGAYLEVAQSGAKALVLTQKHEDGSEYKETVYFTNKKGDNYYLNKDDNTKKVALPGFLVIDHICQMTSGKGLEHQETEEKVVKVYDFDSKKEVNKSVQMLVDILDIPVSLGITRCLVDKTKKGADDKYHATGETKEENHIEKVFHTDTHLTMAEAEKGEEKGVFWDAWLEKNKGKVINKVKGVEGKTAGSGGALPQPSQAAANGRTSLFGPKS